MSTNAARKLLVNLRSVFITAIKDEERIGFSKEVLLIQLVATKLQHHRLLKMKEIKPQVSKKRQTWYYYK